MLLNAQVDIIIITSLLIAVEPSLAPLYTKST